MKKIAPLFVLVALFLFSAGTAHAQTVQTSFWRTLFNLQEQAATVKIQPIESVPDRQPAALSTEAVPVPPQPVPHQPPKKTPWFRLFQSESVSPAPITITQPADITATPDSKTTAPTAKPSVLPSVIINEAPRPDNDYKPELPILPQSVSAPVTEANQIGEINKEAEEQIRVLKAEMELKIKTIRKEYQEKIDAIRKSAQVKKEEYKESIKTIRVENREARKETMQEIRNEVKDIQKGLNPSAAGGVSATPAPKSAAPVPAIKAPSKQPVQPARQAAPVPSSARPR